MFFCRIFISHSLSSWHLSLVLFSLWEIHSHCSSSYWRTFYQRLFPAASDLNLKNETERERERRRERTCLFKCLGTMWTCHGSLNRLGDKWSLSSCVWFRAQLAWSVLYSSTSSFLVLITLLLSWMCTLRTSFPLLSLIRSTCLLLSLTPMKAYQIRIWFIKHSQCRHDPFIQILCQ